MRVYLDHNATTPLRDEVTAAMVEVLRANYGNASSTHAEDMSWPVWDIRVSSRSAGP